MLQEEKLQYFKDKLLNEKEELEDDLRHVGRRNPRVPGDWETKDPGRNTGIGDEADASETEREFGNSAAIEETLESELEHVRAALSRIEDGTYGVCSSCGKYIGAERLEAYPASETCLDCDK